MDESHGTLHKNILVDFLLGSGDAVYSFKSLHDSETVNATE